MMDIKSINVDKNLIIFLREKYADSVVNINTQEELSERKGQVELINTINDIYEATR